MVINMDYYVQDRLEDIWQKINSLHLSYLVMVESPQKLEQRNKIEDCINDFLCLAPHNQKFCLAQTAEVLHRSASSKTDFSGYKAALGWNAVGMYAGNLLAQPWRREYKQIKMYCGFYKHEIEANLVGAESMFEAMGYKYVGDGILILDGPVCPDRVTQVSLDSLVAYVECQILKAIWEEVSKSFNVSWLDVLEFRENHLCSPKQSVQSLNYRFHQRQYQEQHLKSHSQGSESFHGTARYPLAIHPPTPVLSSNHSFPPFSGFTHMPAPSLPPHCIYGNNGYYGTYGPIPSHYQYTMPLPYQHHMKPQYHNNFFYSNGYAPAPQGYMYPVPTAQLIETDHAYDVPDGNTGNRRSSLQQPADVYRRKNENDYKSNNNTDKEEGSGTFESWDYVYRNLESQGYSKDLGERGDVLSPSLERKANIKEAKRVKTNGIEEAVNKLSLIEQPLKTTDALEKQKQPGKNKETEQKDIHVTPTSSYDNLSGNEVHIDKQEPAYKATISKTLPKQEKIERHSAPKASQSKTIDHRKLNNKSNDSDKRKSKFYTSTNNNNNWNCQSCTFLNNSSTDICEMCCKSKELVSQNMEVGGLQCSKCTLVNPKDVKICQACSRSLKDSPTYI